MHTIVLNKRSNGNYLGISKETRITSVSVLTTEISFGGHVYTSVVHFIGWWVPTDNGDFASYIVREHQTHSYFIAKETEA